MTSIQAHERSARLARFGAWFAEWWRNGAQGSEFGGLPQGEREHMAHDLGLTAGDLERLEGGERDAARLMYQPLKTVGVDLGALGLEGTALLHDLERTCSFCRDRGVCMNDLAERSDDPRWKDYCTNSGTIDALLELQARKSGATGKD